MKGSLARLLLIPSLLSALSTLARPTYAESFGRNTLVGLPGVAILTARSAQGGYAIPDSATIVAHTEFRLRQSGVTVLSERDAHADARGPFLSVYVNVYGGKNTVCCAYVDVTVLQRVRTLRADDTPVLSSVVATTWLSSERLGMVPAGIEGRRMITQSLDEQLDEFLRDWLATHPKR